MPRKLKEFKKSDEESDEDTPEDEEDTQMTIVSTTQVDDSNAETVEKVLKHRDGIPGAIGPPTTTYNVEEKGDPNQGAESKFKQIIILCNNECFIAKAPNELERQFLIKWVGWSHLHNTWESQKSLSGSNVKGIKKI